MKAGTGSTTYCRSLKTRFGEMLMACDGERLVGLYFVGQKGFPEAAAQWRRDDDAQPFARVIEQLGRYAAGERVAFDLPLAMHGTAFQRSVWTALLTVPFGRTISYSELAARAGVPKAVRAVGAAVGRNPVSVIVPCHRIIGADGSLTGYAGGLDRKRELLALEGVL